MTQTDNSSFPSHENGASSSHTPTVGILGLGYVGLTLSTILADIGFRVVGIDRDAPLIADLKQGKPHFHEKGLEQMLEAVAQRPNPPQYQVGLPESCADIYIVTVGTPIQRPSLEPNLDHVRSAIREVASVLRRGNFVILRSTVPVGTTRDVVLPVLEQTSSLKVGVDFDLAFCPERTVEGKALRELRELPQIIGGYNDASAKRARDLFQKVTSTVIDLGSIEAAEMLKIMDNTYRDMMFAYANQIALVCNALHLDMVPIVRAANQGYNRNNIPIPSPGVGGACLSKDPYILANVCRKAGIDPTLFVKGREVNEFMPIHTVSCVYEAMSKLGNGVSGGTVLVLGFAFKGKPDTSDMRDSPTLDLVQELRRRGARVLGHDPLVPSDEIEALGVELVSLEEGFAAADAAIVMIDHPLYADLDVAAMAGGRSQPIVVMDSWHLYDAKELNIQPNIIYLNI
ncbi:nucleotide sugar dehydrogenase [bacterium]|nr:nucleotide sugar dehydrogenase [bacterium]